MAAGLAGYKQLTRFLNKLMEYRRNVAMEFSGMDRKSIRTRHWLNSEVRAVSAITSRTMISLASTEPASFTCTWS